MGGTEEVPKVIDAEFVDGTTANDNASVVRDFFWWIEGKRIMFALQQGDIWAFHAGVGIFFETHKNAFYNTRAMEKVFAAMSESCTSQIVENNKWMIADILSRIWYSKKRVATRRSQLKQLLTQTKDRLHELHYKKQQYTITGNEVLDILRQRWNYVHKVN